MIFRILALTFVGILAATATTKPAYNTIVLETYLVSGVNSSLASESALNDAAKWLGRHLPGATVVALPPRHIDIAWSTGSDAEIETLWRRTAKQSIPGKLRIAVGYVPTFEHGSMGRAWHDTGSAFVVMNAERLGRFAGPTGMLERERRTLYHELIHASGFIPAPDHLSLINGYHCTQVECMLHPRVRLIDIFAYLFPNDLAASQPDELCRLCRRELGLP